MSTDKNTNTKALAERAEAVRAALREQGFDTKYDGQIRGRLIVERAVDLSDAELERVFANTVLPDFCIRYAKAARESGLTIEDLQAEDAAAHNGMSAAHRDWIEVLHRETGMSGAVATQFANKLHDLAAKHFKLCHMEVADGLTDQQEAARDAIEGLVRGMVEGVNGVKGAVFMADPRGTTVGLKFVSGSYNSFSEGGCYKVPLEPSAFAALEGVPFWELYASAEADGEQVVFKSKYDDVYIAKMPNGHLAITDGISTDYVNIRGLNDWTRESDQLVITQEMRDFLSSVESVEGAVKAGELRAQMPEASRFIVVSINETDNAAFRDIGRDAEVARILKDAAERISVTIGIEDTKLSLRDINGNTVGNAVFTRQVPTDELEPGAVRLAIELGNAAFEDDAGREVARIMRVAASRIEHGDHDFMLHDINGNPVGAFAMRDLPSLANDGVVSMAEALAAGRVYRADEGYSGIAEGEFRYIVPTTEYDPGYGETEGEVWLVNAKGEIAAGYEDGQTVRENLLNDLSQDQKADLRAVAEGRMSFEDHERKYGGDDDLEP